VIKQQTLNVLGAISLLALLTACGERMSFKENIKTIQAAPGAPGSPPPSTEELYVDSTPQCVVDLPHFQISGNVNSFEFQSSFGINFGYTPGGNYSGTSGSVSMKVSKAQMDLVMIGKDPLTRALATSSNVNSNQTKTDLGLTIDFSQFQGNPNYYLSTPLAKVSQKGLELALKDFKKQSDQQLWVGRILKNINKEELMVNHGSQAGLMKGDQFEIYNVDHFWEAEPCTSAYVGSKRTTSAPVAIVEVDQLSQSSSVTKYVFKGKENIRRGAEVIVKKLQPNGNQARYLKKKITLGKISAKPFQLPGNILFDMESVINSQLITTIHGSGTYYFEIK